jgi:hypothetical protein
MSDPSWSVNCLEDDNNPISSQDPTVQTSNFKNGDSDMNAEKLLPEPLQDRNHLN